MATERTMQKIAIALGKRYDAEQIAFANGSGGSAGIAPSIGGTAVIPQWTLDIRANAWAETPLASDLDSDDPILREVVRRGRFRLTIMGTCMEPDYMDGETVEFEIARADMEPLALGADYAVCRSDGKATFKRLYEITDDSLILFAVNQKKYPGTIEVARQEVSRIARAVFSLKTLVPHRLPKLGRAKR